jgi:hypothetical protein
MKVSPRMVDISAVVWCLYLYESRMLDSPTKF